MVKNIGCLLRLRKRNIYYDRPSVGQKKIMHRRSIILFLLAVTKINIYYIYVITYPYPYILQFNVGIKNNNTSFPTSTLHKKHSENLF